MFLPTLLVLCSTALALGQRPSFAGSRPIGYPVVTTTEGLGDRFGEVDGTTQKLPVEANGDRELVDRLSKLPINQQPFWFINWQALEANRQKPQTYPQKPNQFIDTIIPTDTNSGNPSFNSVNENSNFEPATDNRNSVTNDYIPANVNSTFESNSNSNSLTSANSNRNVTAFATSNRFGAEELPKVPSTNQNKVDNAFTNINSGNRNIGNSSVVPKKNKPIYIVPQPYYLK